MRPLFLPRRSFTRRRELVAAGCICRANVQPNLIAAKSASLRRRRRDALSRAAGSKGLPLVLWSSEAAKSRSLSRVVATTATIPPARRKKKKTRSSKSRKYVLSKKIYLNKQSVTTTINIINHNNYRLLQR